MTDLAKLVVKLEAETSRFATELEKANRKLSGFERSANNALGKIKQGFAGLAAGLTVGALTSFIKNSIDAADRMKDLAEQTGETTETISALGFAAEQSGSDLPTLTTGLKALSKQAQAASEGSENATAAFAALGVTVTETNGALKPSSVLLSEIATGFASYEDGVAKAALAQELFGRNGLELIPLLNQGAAGIAELTARAAELGIVVDTQAAAAADRFNDQLNEVKGQVGGAGRAIAAELLPTLSNLLEAFTTTSAGGESLKVVAQGIGGVMKLVASATLIASKVFESAGRAIGGFAAAAVAVFQGEFARAASIFSANVEDDANSAAATLKTLEKIWADAGANVVATAEKTDAAVKKTLVFGGGGGGGKGGKKEKDVGFDLEAALAENEKYFTDLDKLTRTSTENTIAQYAEQKKALEALWAAGRIGVDTYNARLEEFYDDNLGYIETTSKRVVVAAEEAAEKVSTFADQAARNTVDIIADGLRTGFEDGARGVLDAVARMLIDITAQIVAADLGKRLFGDLSAPGGGGGGGGIIGKLLGGIGSFFGFSGVPRDQGGRGIAGMPYAIGVGAQPEVFVPDTSGEFYPAGAMGGVNVTQNFTIDAPTGTVTRRTEVQIGAAAARGLSQASRRNN